LTCVAFAKTQEFFMNTEILLLDTDTKSADTECLIFLLFYPY
jgi:hypothetical protein